MKSWDQKEIEQHLRSGMEEAAPDEGRRLWAQICSQADQEKQTETDTEEPSAGSAWYLKGTSQLGKDTARSRRRWAYGMVSAAAVLVIAFALSMQMRVRKEAAPWARVCLDVNPGLTLEVNEQERVIRAQAENTDAELLLDNMDLENVNIDVAVNAIIGSMVRNGYLTQEKQFILLTVDGQDKDAAQILRQDLSHRIDRSMEKLTGYSAVFDQLATPDQEVEELSLTYGITMGKAFLLKKLVMVNPQLEYAELAGLTMEELYGHLREAGIDLSDYADYTGDELEEEEFTEYEDVEETESESDLSLDQSEL